MKHKHLQCACTQHLVELAFVSISDQTNFSIFVMHVIILSVIQSFPIMAEFLKPGANRAETSCNFTEAVDAQWTNRMEALGALFNNDGHLCYSAFVSHVFPRRDKEFHFHSLWKIANEYAVHALDAHPYAHSNGLQSLWTAEPPETEFSEFYADFRLTGSGVLLLVEAWNQHGIVHPTAFTAVEFKELSFWRCYGADLIRLVFSTVSLPHHLRSGTSNPELQQRMSNMHMQEAVAAASGTAASGTYAAGPTYNRPRYATQFSRIQAYGLHRVPSFGGSTGHGTGEDTSELRAFFLPASQILAHMQKYFRSSSAFEGQRWTSVEAYHQHAQWTNIMLLNVCSEVSRQIVQMFRIQEAADPSALLLPLGELLDEEVLSSSMPTLTERILGHNEPLEWLPPVGINLQRFLSGSSSSSTPAGWRGLKTAAPDHMAQEAADAPELPLLTPSAAVMAMPKRRGRPPKIRTLPVAGAEAAVDPSSRKIARVGAAIPTPVHTSTSTHTDSAYTRPPGLSTMQAAQLAHNKYIAGSMKPLTCVQDLHNLLTPACGHELIEALTSKMRQNNQRVSLADVQMTLQQIVEELRANPELRRSLQEDSMSILSYVDRKVITASSPVSEP